MAFEVVMPRLGWDMEVGSLVEWFKQDGDYVEAGERLFAVEGDKATQEVEALDSGILRIPPNAPAPSEEVAVGTLLAFLVPRDELPTFSFGGAATDLSPAARTESASSVAAERSPAAPALGNAPRRTDRRTKISPVARRIATELGIDWAELKGSGTGGRITARDVQAAAGSQAAAPAVQPPAPARSALETRMPIAQIRKTIAERMSHSAHTSAPVTLTTEADATELVRLRSTLKDDVVSDDPVPTYNDLLVKIVAEALAENPALSAHIEGDEIVQPSSINIALAVDTERGLLAPVLRDVRAKGLRQIARESAALIEKTHSGSIQINDLQGGVFTITNLGMYDIDVFTPIINLPQCAILGVGRIRPKQVVIDPVAEQVAVRRMMSLSLTFDHRLVDGGPAARFLQRIKQLIENPYRWLAG